MTLKRMILILSICILLLTSCDFASGEGDETMSAEQVLTFVAETVNAALSLTPQPSATSTPTATATATATFTPSPSATHTSTIPSSEGTGGNTGGQTSDCDNAAFVSDVTIPDGTQFAPGTTFTKTWRMQNSGTCAWTTAYSAVFLNGDPMSGVSPKNLVVETAAGVTGDISVDLVSPAAAGTYRGYWQLQNAAGQAFGHKFYVEIVVTGDSTTTVTATSTATGATSTPTNTLAATSTFTNTVVVPTATDTPTETATTPSQPDLSASLILNPASPAASTPVDITIQVSNTGTANAGAFTVEWWADSGDASPANTWAVSSVAAGSSVTLNYTYAGYPASGNYNAQAVADSTGAIAESNEGNNNSTVTVTVP